MTRSLNASAVTNVTGVDVYPVLFVALDFTTPVYVHSDVGTLTHTPAHGASPVSYLGVGNLGSISPIIESSKIQANSVEVSLSGINTAYISLALSTDYQGRDASIDLGLRNPTDNTFIDYVTVFSGVMDNISMEFNETAVISVRLVDEFVRFDKSNNRRWNNADQQKEYPLDQAFSYQDTLNEQYIVWGGIPNV